MDQLVRADEGRRRCRCRCRLGRFGRRVLLRAMEAEDGFLDCDEAEV